MVNVIVTKPDIQAGQSRTKPDKTSCADVRQPDKAGHIPLGMSGCPGGLSDVRLSGHGPPAFHGRSASKPEGKS
jgi:hypothetical protein